MDASHTETGRFKIGVRRGWSDWNRDLDKLTEWLVAERFACVDIGLDAETLVAQVVKTGLALGSVDLPLWKELISPDAATRRDAVARCSAYIESVTRAAGTPQRFFVVMLPQKPEASRRDNFGWMVESYAALSPALEKHGGKVVVEGWPGPGALCCTPETLRALFRECPSPALGVNYDPSHLLRMGIDPIRFLDEFVSRIFHVHGKDCEVFGDAIYDLGYEQPPTFAAHRGFGGATWRYTIPGHGAVRWTEAFRRLEAAGYSGYVSIELEDERFNGTEEGEKRALRLSRDFLMSV